MKQSNWDSYWDKKINEHFNVKPAERIVLREFVEQVFNEKYGIVYKEAGMGGENLQKRDNLPTFLKMIDDGTPFDLSDAFKYTKDKATGKKVSKYDFNSEDAKKVTIIKDGPNTKASLAAIQDYLNDKREDFPSHKELRFDTDLYKGETEETYVIGMSSIEKTDVFGGKGGKDPDGAQWEELFVYVFNGQKEKDLTPAVEKFMDPYVQQAIAMVKSMKTKIPAGAVGTGGTPGTLSDIWKRGFANVDKVAQGATKTSKTDVKSGKYKMSFKKAGGSQLMSGGQGETFATFMAVSEKLIKPAKMAEWMGDPKNPKKGSMAHLMKNRMDAMALPTGKATGDLQKSVAKKKGKNLNADEKAIKFMDESHDVLQEESKDMFEKDIPKNMARNLKGETHSRSFKHHFVHEAMTGAIKFDNSDATANYVFVFEPARSKVTLKVIDTAEVESVASKTSYNFSFKSSGVGGRTWSAFKLIYQDKKKVVKEGKDFQDLYSQVFTEQYDILRETFVKAQSGNLLKEDLQRNLDRSILSEETKKHIVEGLFGKVWDKVKSGAIALADWAQAAWNQIKAIALESMSFVWEKMKEFAAKGLSMFMKFIGLEVDTSSDPMPQQPDVGAILLDS